MKLSEVQIKAMGKILMAEGKAASTGENLRRPYGIRDVTFAALQKRDLIRHDGRNGWRSVYRTTPKGFCIAIDLLHEIAIAEDEKRGQNEVVAQRMMSMKKAIDDMFRYYLPFMTNVWEHEAKISSTHRYNIAICFNITIDLCLKHIRNTPFITITKRWDNTKSQYETTIRTDFDNHYSPEIYDIFDIVEIVSNDLPIIKTIFNKLNGMKIL